MNDIESIFRKLACAFCRFPDDLRVSYAESNQSIIVVYTAHADDTRKLIGKGGAMYKALETVLAAVTARRRLKSRLIVDEPHTGQPLETVRFETNTNWTETRVRMLMIEICMLLFTEQPEITFHRISTDASTLLLQVG